MLGIEKYELKDVCDIVRGKRITKNDLIENGTYKVVSGGEGILGYYDKYNREENTITIAQYGSAGYVNFIKEKFWANDVCYSLIPKEKIDNKFLYYTIKNKQNLLYKLRTDAVPSHLPIEKLSAVKVYRLPLFIQQKIVATLDKFEEISNDTQKGLQLNIQQERKRYEYYRNKLLTFKEKI